MTIRLRSYQLDAIQRVREELAEKDSTLIDHPTGCVSGDTIVTINRGGKSVTRTIAKHFACQSDPKVRREIPSMVRAYLGCSIGLHVMARIVDSGWKWTQTLLLENGRTIRATPDHEILTESGFVQLGALSKSHEVICDSWRSGFKRPRAAKTRYRRIEGMRHHPNARSIWSKGYRVAYVWAHRATVEAAMNSMTLEQFVAVCRNHPAMAAQCRFLDPKIDVHHRNGDTIDNRLENLEPLPRVDHNRLHDKKRNTGMFDPVLSRVQGIVDHGYENTYDIVCADPHRNFVANGIVVHNCGKTTSFCSYATEHLEESAMNSVVILAHRKELVRQNANRMTRMSGIVCGVEMGETSCCDFGLFPPRVVSASVDTLRSHAKRGRGKLRAHKFSPTLCIIDEAHHAACQGYKKIVLAFRENNPKCKLLGVSATPRRHDGDALIFESTAHSMSIREAIEEGWLVPIKQLRQYCSSLDLSKVKNIAGELNKGELAEVVERDSVLWEMVVPFVKRVGVNWRTIVYGVTVAQVEKIRDIINAQRLERTTGSAIVIHGETPDDERDAGFDQFARGTHQHLCNVGIATEGWDDPCHDMRGVQCIAMMRPMRSQPLYMQCVGRGLRPLPGICDAFETADERRRAIANSAKPCCYVLDYVGNAGRHKLAHAGAILGGELVLEPDRPKGEMEERDVLSEVKAEELRRKIAEEEAKAARERDRLKKLHSLIDANFTEEEIEPFAKLNITPRRVPNWFKGKAPTANQVGLLNKYGVGASAVPKEFDHARQLLDELTKKPTPKMAWKMRQLGIDPTQHDFKSGLVAIDAAMRGPTLTRSA